MGMSVHIQPEEYTIGSDPGHCQFFGNANKEGTMGIV
jgi:hypothetical protein